jgi:glycosyltransferase involved in cell wall biosynthesis
VKVLFYLLDGDTNASTWHRALQFFPLLRQHGLEPHASRPVPQGFYERLIEGRRPGARQKLAFYNLFFACRLVDVLRAGRYAVVVIQRDLFPFGPPVLERLLRCVNPRIVFDTDDAVYLRPSFTPDTLFQRFRQFNKAAEVVRHARWVSVATAPIAAWARQHNPRVAVVPMALDLTRYDAIRLKYGCGGQGSLLSTQRLVLGWTGTTGSVRYLESLAPVLQQIAERFPIQVRVVTGAHHRLRLPGVPLDARPWRAETALDDLAGFDVGLVPLDDTPFERAKFPFKLLQYLALGVPAVCSPVGAVTEVVHHGENGLLADSPNEWRVQLGRIIADGALRHRLTRAGHETVAQRYTINRVAPLLADGLREAAR